MLSVGGCPISACQSPAAMQALALPSLDWLHDLPASFVAATASPSGPEVTGEQRTSSEAEPLRLAAVCPLSGSQTKVLLFGWGQSAVICSMQANCTLMWRLCGLIQCTAVRNLVAIHRKAKTW